MLMVLRNRGDDEMTMTAIAALVIIVAAIIVVASLPLHLRVDKVIDPE